MLNFLNKLFLVFLGISILGLGGLKLVFYVRENEIMREARLKETLIKQIVEGISTQPVNITIDYSKQISTGSPLIFGGVHTPDLSQQDAWNKIQDAGVTMIRTDFAINVMLPNTTLESYKNNVNNIQDPSNWNVNQMEEMRQKFAEAKKRGMKTIGIVDYIPPWLAYNNTQFGVPKDWSIFEDLVKKMYAYYRDELDYVEIWNEPNSIHFLNLSGSGMSREEAYKNIFYHAAIAIREIDQKAQDGKNIPIGGPVNSEPTDTSLLEAILSDEKTQNTINFISYHNYEYVAEPSWTSYEAILKEYHKENLPVFITEWNADLSLGNNPLFYSDSALPYTGNKFISYLKMGLQGANYFSLQSLNPSNTNSTDNSMGFYQWINNQAVLLPQAKTWRLMSKTLGLGNGNSAIVETTQDSNILNTTGFINNKNEPGLAIVNSSLSSQAVEMNLKNVHIKKQAVLDIYFASPQKNGDTLEQSQKIDVDKNSINYQFYIPPQAILGILIFDSNNNNLFNILNQQSN